MGPDLPAPSERPQFTHKEGSVKQKLLHGALFYVSYRLIERKSKRPIFSSLLR